MKCVKRTVQVNDSTALTQYTRVSDAKAQHMVLKEGWQYCCKIEWKQAGRPRR